MSPRSTIQNAEIRKKSKQKILDAAIQLVAKNGYEGTSVAMIAKKAGVSKGLLYNYFTSKEELLKELVHSIIELGGEFEASMDNLDPKEAMGVLIEWFFQEIRERMDYWRVLTELTIKIEKFDFVREIVSEKMNEYISLLEQLLSKLGFEDPLGEARLLSALFDGIGMQAIIARESYPLDELEQFLLNKYCK